MALIQSKQSLRQGNEISITVYLRAQLKKLKGALHIRAKINMEMNGDENESSDDVVVADVVGKKITCINKLRAIDYGVLKGKIARVRSFHKTMYLILRRDQNSEVLDQPVGHHTVEATKQAEPLGRFTISDIVSNMTVSEYAASIGLYQDHGDKISSLNEEKISTVRHQLEDDVQGQTSARQILNLVQTLTRLELVESGGNSQWALSGGVLIRDFGRGMPSGVMPHGIMFSSMEAVNTYWRELEQFARCRTSRKPLHVEPEGIEDETKPFGKEINNEIRSVSDVYFPMRWATGVVRLQKRYQLIYESMLQLLSGVQLELNLPNTLITTSFLDRPLRRFSIEELEEGFERYRDRIPGLRATQRSMPSHEKLLLYSRYRMKNPMPSWIRQREDNNQSPDPAALKLAKTYQVPMACTDPHEVINNPAIQVVIVYLVLRCPFGTLSIRHPFQKKEYQPSQEFSD